MIAREKTVFKLRPLTPRNFSGFAQSVLIVIEVEAQDEQSAL